MPKSCCKNCDWWDGQRCYYNPPVVITDGYEVGACGHLTVYPETHQNAICSKWKPEAPSNA